MIVPVPPAANGPGCEASQIDPAGQANHVLCRILLWTTSYGMWMAQWPNSFFRAQAVDGIVAGGEGCRC